MSSKYDEFRAEILAKLEVGSSFPEVLAMLEKKGLSGSVSSLRSWFSTQRKRILRNRIVVTKNAEEKIVKQTKIPKVKKLIDVPIQKLETAIEATERKIASLNKDNLNSVKTFFKSKDWGS